jgi:site-specific recombinase XerD
MESGLSRSSVLFLLYAARSFYAFLVRRGDALRNPFAEIRKPKAEKHLPAHLPKEAQMGELLTELSHFEGGARLVDRVKAYRAHVAAELLYATGIRASEAAGLTVGDIDFEGGLVRVRQGKGGVSRTAILGSYAAGVLKVYLTRMRDLVLDDRHQRSQTLLFGVKWNSFSECVNGVYRECCTHLGLSKVTCHLFRHAVGYHLLRAGCNIRYIQDILGHKELRSTELYTRVDTEDLRDVVDRFHPRRWSA